HRKAFGLIALAAGSRQLVLARAPGIQGPGGGSTHNRARFGESSVRPRSARSQQPYFPAFVICCGRPQARPALQRRQRSFHPSRSRIAHPPPSGNFGQARRPRHRTRYAALLGPDRKMSNRPAKVLLLHPGDPIPALNHQPWHLIVDLGRAPAATYDEWSRTTNCKIVSVFDFADGTDDLHRTRQLLELGMGKVVDQFGIDWWDVLVQSIVPELQQLTYLSRLGAGIEPGTDIYCTQLHFLSTALQHIAGGKLVIFEGPWRSLRRKAGHYAQTLGRLDFAQ